MCNFPLVRDGNDCIDLNECLARSDARKLSKQRQLNLEIQCGPYSEWDQCGSACPITCEKINDEPINCSGVSIWK